MVIPIDEVVVFDVTTHHPSTGAVTDADSGPTYDVFEEVTDTPILDDQTLTKRTSLTGNYRGSFTASAANGFEAGKWYSVIATATVNSITAKCAALLFRVTPAETSAGVPQVRAAALADGILGSATFAAGAINAAAIAADAITDAKVASDVTIASVTGAVGSVTGAVGSIATGGIAAASFAAGAIDAAAIAANAIGASELAADAVTEIQSGLATAAALTTVSGLVDDLETRLTATRAGYLDNLSAGAAALQASVDALEAAVIAIEADTQDLQARVPAALVSGRIDTSVGAMAANVMTAAAAAADLTTELQSGLATAASLATLSTTVGAAGAGLTAVPWNAAWDAEVQSEVQDALDATLADSVPADGTRPSIAQALYMLVQFMTERAVSGTTVTVKKVDGSTSLLTLTLNDATTPTSVTRAT